MKKLIMLLTIATATPSFNTHATQQNYKQYAVPATFIVGGLTAWGLARNVQRINNNRQLKMTKAALCIELRMCSDVIQGISRRPAHHCATTKANFPCFSDAIDELQPLYENGEGHAEINSYIKSKGSTWRSAAVSLGGIGMAAIGGICAVVAYKKK